MANRLWEPVRSGACLAAQGRCADGMRARCPSRKRECSRPGCWTIQCRCGCGRCSAPSGTFSAGEPTAVFALTGPTISRPHSSKNCREVPECPASRIPPGPPQRDRMFRDRRGLARGEGGVDAGEHAADAVADPGCLGVEVVVEPRAHLEFGQRVVAEIDLAQRVRQRSGGVGDREWAAGVRFCAAGLEVGGPGRQGKSGTVTVARGGTALPSTAGTGLRRTSRPGFTDTEDAEHRRGPPFQRDCWAGCGGVVLSNPS